MIISFAPHRISPPPALPRIAVRRERDRCRAGLRSTQAEAQAKPAPVAGKRAGPGAAAGDGRQMAGLLLAAGPLEGLLRAVQGRGRIPANLKDVEGLLFVSSRPTEGVRNEISFVMNFDLKEDVEHQAIIGTERFALVAKGQNMWLKNPAEEPRMLDALRKGAGLEIKGTSKRGNPTSDKYSLAGMNQTVKRPKTPASRAALESASAAV
jgi:hypothetical protein